MTHADYEELKKLDEAYRQLFPDAEVFDYENSNLSYEPAHYLRALREANGREIFFTTPEDQQDGGNFSFIEVSNSKQFNPITLQELLYNRNPKLKEARVKLVRHRDTSGAIDRHEQYRTDRPAFLEYQREQGNRVFHDCDYVVSCLGENGRRARFVGVYRVQGIERETAEHYFYHLTEVAGFDDLKERVIIDWGKAAISWQQWLHSETPKTVLEIQPRPFSEAFKPFKGYLDFVLDFSELKHMLATQTPQDEWCLMLSAVYGVYLILDKSNGHHYIGAAYGTQGVWQRWSEYVSTGGHGGNQALKELVGADTEHARHFQFTLLITWPRTTSYSDEVLKWEQLFKLKINPKLCRN